MTDNPVKSAVEAQFATRPSLRSVVERLLADNLKEKYPPLTLPVTSLRLALPRDGGGRGLTPLLSAALDYLATQRLPDLASHSGLDAYLSDATGTRLTFESNGPRSYDLTVISALIRELPLILAVGFQDALTAYWNQPSDADGSRWQWLAAVLQGRLRTSAIRQTGSDAHALQRLIHLADYPARETRNRHTGPLASLHAYSVETRLAHGDTRVTLQSSDIVLVDGEQVWLCSLQGRIDSFASLDAFGEAWGRRMAQQYVADSLTWHLYEPDGNIFEVQAALILNEHLDNLAAIDLSVVTPLNELEQVFHSLTDPAAQLDPPADTPPQSLATLRTALPGWLQHASAGARFAYRQCLLEQASARRVHAGKTWLDGLHSIRSYATQHLNNQLCLARNAWLTGQRTCESGASIYQADNLQLSFAVPVGSLGSGYIEPVRMSLVDLALNNLSGKPQGRMTVRSTDGQAIEAWLTPDVVAQLVQRVDVGRNYPNYIRRELLGDTDAAQQRKRLFIAQRPLQLKSQALEHATKREAGLTPKGFEYAAAVVGASHAERYVDDNEIVMRPLAFARKPGATADVVQHMFIIEPRNGLSGPHLLYRPAYAQALMEFSSREQLLAAIVQPGELQDSVLAWLADSARAIYSNGGFTQPHYVRIGGIGAEFDPLPAVPKPAKLADPFDESNDEILQSLTNGQLMEYLFTSEARQLLEQADRESTSNAESRWKLILEGAQLGFNTLLMLVRGPLAAAGWLLQLAQGLAQDLPALASNDPIARELAWVDLLLNTATVLVHQVTSTSASPRPIIDEHAHQRALARLPLRRTPGEASPALPTVKRGAFGLPAEPPGGGHTLLDFDRSLASDAAAARLLEKLLEVKVAWPTPVPEPVSLGALKGLYKIDGHWHASVGGLLFQVNVVPGFGEVFIVHPQKPAHPGIKLKTDGRGHWTLDRGLKLEGGGPKRIAALREANRRKTQELVDRMQALSLEITPRMHTYLESQARMNSAYKALKKQADTLRLVWTLLQNASEAQQPALQARHLREMQDYAKRRAHYDILLDALQTQFDQSLPSRLELVQVGQSLEKVAGAAGNVQDRAKVLKTIGEQQMALHFYQVEWARNLQMTDRGESMLALSERMVIDNLWGDNTAFEQYVAQSISLADAIERMAESTRKIETTLDQLEQDSAAGRAMRQQLLAQITNPQEFFPDSLKLRALIPLIKASVEIGRMLPAQEAFYVERLKPGALIQALFSHIEVRSSADYPLEDQRGVYETVLDNYREYESAIQALKLINPNRLKPASARLLEGLHYARTLAQNELEAVVRKQEQLEVQLPLSKTLRPKAATKRVFKTAGKQYLIGELQPADAQVKVERYTISDALSGTTVTTFEQRPDGWTDVREPQPTAAPPVAPARELATLKTLGQALINGRAAIERVIAAQQQALESPSTRQTVNPGDWDALLNSQAAQLTALADEVAREHLDKPTANDLIDDFKANARDMQRMAQRVCSAAYKRQWPTQESLDYLWRQGEIDINLTSPADPQRPTLSGDFFTEYAVYDKTPKPPTVLWYAHFHYATADAAPADYTRAHLKLAEQRKYTQKDLLKAHVQAALPGTEPVRQILYVLITPPVDQLFLAIAPRSGPR